MGNHILEIHNLSVGFITDNQLNTVIDDLSFHINEGEILGIVGESGSGKSMTALSILGLLPNQAKMIQGSILFEGTELTNLTEREYRKIRGDKISMVFQEPMTSLNPVLTIERQVKEMLQLHKREYAEKQEDLKKHVLSVFEEVGLRDPEQVYKKYPHQLSGGMRQRVMIAMAIILRPKLLIADEPTTALDVTLQLKLLDLIKKINLEYKISVLLISHDLSVIKMLCDRAVILCDGKVEEEGEIKYIFNNSVNKYTKKLMNSIDTSDIRIDTYNKKDDFLLVKNLDVFYREKKESIFSKKARNHVVKNATFSLRYEEVLGIVGESGSGKSSMVKAITGLIEYEGGEIRIEGGKRIFPQMVFQDPYGSLNPSKKIGWILEEPLKLHTKLNKAERIGRVGDMLIKVGLTDAYMNRYPSELSGGQRQRVAIALALMLNQKIMILDEPVSALDVTIQKQILKLLIDLKQEYGLSYIFITHDMNVVKSICDRVCVMYKGEIVEMNDAKEIFDNPKHEYTKKLLRAVI